MSKVAVIPCREYERERVYRAIKTGVDAVGGLSSFVRPEEKILVKPNFLYPSDASKAITTHPTVIEGVLRLLEEEGYRHVLMGDSPANGTSKAAAEKLGLLSDLTSLHGAVLAEMDEGVTVPVKDGMAAKTLRLCREVTEADAVIGVCKMKTHMLERVTGAVKNMYGLIAGKEKAKGHVLFPNALVFAKMLTDIHKTSPQRLHVMDGIIAMEGNGPSSGSPVNMGVILVSRDPVALDTVFCWLIHLDPALVPTNTQGALGGIGTHREKEIEVLLAEVGEAPKLISRKELTEKLGKPDFDVQRDREKLSMLGLLSRLTGTKNKRPAIMETKCIKCGICVDHCPVEGSAVTFAKGKANPPVYDYTKCIRCYCCQELCPSHAIHQIR